MPRTGPKPGQARKKVRASYRVLLHGNQVCLVQRPANATLMASMWELPQVKGGAMNSTLRVRVRHSITNTDFEVLAFLEMYAEKRKIKESSAKWIHLQRVNRLPLTGLTRKILRHFSLLK